MDGIVTMMTLRVRGTVLLMVTVRTRVRVE